MKVRVRYRQKYSMCVFRLFRIIELKPNNLIFKKRIKTEVLNTYDMSTEAYMQGVRRILNYSKEELTKIVATTISEKLSDPFSLTEEIREFDIELDIDLESKTIEGGD